MLRDASGLQSGKDLAARLLASPGQLREFDSSTAGELPEGDSLGDQILRSLMVIKRHLVGQTMMELDLAAILVEVALPVRLLAADRQNAHTRIPQISLALDFVLHGFQAPHDARKTNV